MAVVGIVLMPMPGPGILVTAVGLTVLAGASSTAARAFDAAELRIRRAGMRVAARWRHSSGWSRAAAVALALGAVVASALGLTLLLVGAVGLA